MKPTSVNWKSELENLRTMGEAGTTMADIARHYGVSRQRVKQICKKYFPDWSESCGYSVRRAYLDEKYQKKWGLKEDSDLYRVKREKYRGKKANAERQGIEFTIAFGEIDWPTHCPILGLELNYFSEGISENSVSFDRLDPSKGYVSGNVLVLSWRANRIKNNGTADEHRKIADYLDTMKNTNLLTCKEV